MKNLKGQILKIALVAFLFSTYAQASRNESCSQAANILKVGARVVTGEFPRIGTYTIEAISVDRSQMLLEGSDSIYELNDKIFSAEVASLNGVEKGMRAVCKHLYGTMSGTVDHVYANGYVEINIKTTTNNCGLCYRSGAPMATTYFSAVPNACFEPAYSCAYFPAATEEISK